VEEGDTLYDIARYELGAGGRWPEIYQLNAESLGDDFDYLRPGTKLVLPAVRDAAREDPVAQQPDTYQR
jgi:nucleoid-associated protein YgaU